MTNLFFDLEEGWFEIFELVRTFLCRRAPFWLAVRLSSDLSYATPGPAQKQKTDKPTHFGPKKLLRPDFLNQYSQKRQFSGSFVLFSHLSEKRELGLRTRSSHACVVFFSQFKTRYVSFILMKSKRTRHKMSKITWIGIVFIFRAVSFESRDELGLVGRLRSRVTGKRRSKGSTRPLWASWALFLVCAAAHSVCECSSQTEDRDCGDLRLAKKGWRGGGGDQ